MKRLCLAQIGVSRMLVAEQIKRRQPEVYKFLCDCFEIEINIGRAHRQAKNFVEDDYEFRKYQRLMQERSSAQK